MEQNTSAWILSAEISLECDAGRLSHRGRLLFFSQSFVSQSAEKPTILLPRPDLITNESTDLLNKLAFVHFHKPFQKWELKSCCQHKRPNLPQF